MVFAAVMSLCMAVLGCLFVIVTVSVTKRSVRTLYCQRKQNEDKLWLYL